MITWKEVISMALPPNPTNGIWKVVHAIWQSVWSKRSQGYRSEQSEASQMGEIIGIRELIGTGGKNFLSLFESWTWYMLLFLGSVVTTNHNISHVPCSLVVSRVGGKCTHDDLLKSVVAIHSLGPP